MLNERIIVILNLNVPDLPSALTAIHELHNCTHHIKEYNSVFRDGVLLSRLYARVTVNEIVKNIHKRLVEEKTIYALPLTKYKERDYDIYKPPNKFTLSELISNVSEQFCVVNDNTVSTMTMQDPLFTVPGTCAVTSPSGLFVAVAMSDSVLIYGNNAKLDEIHTPGVTSMYFGGEVYLVMEYKELFDYVAVFNVVTGRKLFNGRIGKNKIGFLNRGFYIENTNNIFLNKVSGTGTELISNKDYEKEKFTKEETFCGLDVSLIVKVHQHKNITAILTAEKVPHIVIIKDNVIIKKKNYVNLSDCRFVSSENRLYFLITKDINERPLTTIETFSDEEFTFTQVDSFTEISVSDTAFVFSTADNHLFFYELVSVFALKAKVAKTNKLIFSLNPNGKICVVYDYSNDKIEFYSSGQLVTKHAHSNCTAVTWSHSGLYCATVSSGPDSSGLVQVFNVNGKLVWKRLFNRLSTFAWKGYFKNRELLKEIEDNYAEYVTEEVDEVCEDGNFNIVEEKRKWLLFLEDKKVCLKEAGLNF